MKSYRKEFNERTMALEEMIKNAHKHCPQVLDALYTELEKEKSEIRKSNAVKNRKMLIGK